ncbi:hypothetical protein [Metabacillus fastidiosus]|uniref:hypothetical protein n=1 Tax=Metabacillus fastidiosus TaxID=1458 RepID=UPI002E20E39C|nr:hypothetical protein [Metabacillus fastidiosus]
MLNKLKIMGEFLEKYKESEALKKELQLRELRAKRMAEFSKIVKSVVDENKKITGQFKKQVESYRFLLRGAEEDPVVGVLAKKYSDLYPYLLEYLETKSPESLEKITEIHTRISEIATEIREKKKVN